MSVVSGELMAYTLLQLELASTFDNVELAVDQVGSFLRELEVNEDTAYRVVLLVSEAVTNAMEHGNGWDASKKVHLRVTAGEERIECTVSDEGDGFDPSVVEDPLEEDNILRSCGRGLYFMRSLADEMHVECGGRRLRLAFLSRLSL